MLDDWSRLLADAVNTVRSDDPLGILALILTIAIFALFAEGQRWVSRYLFTLAQSKSFGKTSHSDSHREVDHTSTLVARYLSSIAVA